MPSCAAWTGCRAPTCPPPTCVPVRRIVLAGVSAEGETRVHDIQPHRPRLRGLRGQAGACWAPTCAARRGGRRAAGFLLGGAASMARTQERASPQPSPNSRRTACGRRRIGTHVPRRVRPCVAPRHERRGRGLLQLAQEAARGARRGGPRCCPPRPRARARQDYSRRVSRRTVRRGAAAQGARPPHRGRRGRGLRRCSAVAAGGVGLAHVSGARWTESFRSAIRTRRRRWWRRPTANLVLPCCARRAWAPPRARREPEGPDALPARAGGRGRARGRRSSPCRRTCR